jgi:hypothetical protein
MTIETLSSVCRKAAAVGQESGTTAPFVVAAVVLCMQCSSNPTFAADERENEAGAISAGSCLCVAITFTAKDELPQPVVCH